MTRRARGITIRARLALTYAALLAGTGALMLGVVYLFMRYVPTYMLGGPVRQDGAAASASPVPTAVRATKAPTISISDLASPVISNTDDVFRLLLVISVVSFLVLGIAGAVIGWVIAGRMLRPLQAINRVAKSAAAGDLSQRIGAEGPRDELRDLSETLDDMLARLERSVGEHQRFAANASHELRTPIASTQTMLDVALSDPELDLPALRRTAERVREMNRRNSETVESLLALADAEGGPLRHEPVRLDELVRDALRTEDDAVTTRALTVRTDLHPVVVSGDPVLLRQAVRNLVQNAVRHNVHGGELDVRVRSHPDRSVLTVANTGEVIPVAMVGTLAEPFVRGAGRVADGGRGHGLGLALVRSVAEAHQGRLHLAARERGGLTVTLELPTGGAAVQS